MTKDQMDEACALLWRFGPMRSPTISHRLGFYVDGLRANKLVERLEGGKGPLVLTDKGVRRAYAYREREFARRMSVVKSIVEGFGYGTQ